MSTSRRVFLGSAMWIAGVSALHGKLNVNWAELADSFRGAEGLKSLTVGGLPVTCNLTLPIACLARALDKEAGTNGNGSRPTFEYARYNGWPELKESLISGRVQAA